MIDRPEGIIVTIGQDMIKQNGYRHWLSNFIEAMAGDGHYCLRTGNQPKQVENLMYVYLCIGGKIRFRCNFIKAEGEKTRRFTDGRTMSGKAWILFAGPIKRPRRAIKRKGFQGIRYTEKLF